jgi:DNA-binding response OmpR family regulator
MIVGCLFTTEEECEMRKILIIEDDEYFRILISSFLESEGFYVLSAEHGFIGMILAKEQKPDLIICDIRMPGIDGYGVLENLKKDTSTAIIPFFFLTFETTIDSRRRALELGANDYLTKPVNLSELLKKINIYLHAS